MKSRATKPFLATGKLGKLSGLHEYSDFENIDGSATHSQCRPKPESSMHPLFRPLLAIACFAAAVFAALVYGIQLNESVVVNLIGAALGSGIAVFGAVWATESRERKRAESMSNSLRSLGFMTFKPACDVLLLARKSREDGTLHPDIKNLIALLKERTVHAEEDFKSFQPLLTTMDPSATMSFRLIARFQAIKLEKIAVLEREIGRFESELALDEADTPLPAFDLDERLADIAVLAGNVQDVENDINEQIKAITATR